jgi:hypothetical protein
LTDPASSTPLAPSVADFELTLAQIQGVYASRVVVDRNRLVSEIHIVASAIRRPKQLIRDIETLVFVKHGIKIDYRKISLVQLAEEDLLRLPLARPEIREVVEENMGDQKRIRVAIQGAGRIVRYEAFDKVDNPNPFRTAAKATVGCIEKLVGRQMDVRIENATTLRLDSREIALVILTCLIENREETFVGASFVMSRPAESAARATLDALNRRLMLMNTLRTSEVLEQGPNGE